MTVGIVILQETVRRSDIVALADALAWRIVAEVSRGHLVLASERWTTPDGLQVTHVEDHTGDVRFIEVKGARPDPTVMLLHDRLPTYPEDDLLARAEGSPSPLELVRLLSRLAVCRPEAPTARHLTVWERALQHPEVAVRRAAIRTAHECAWPEAIGLVRARAAVEDRVPGPLGRLLVHLEDRDASASTSPLEP